MVRAASYANEVWLGHELALRINPRGPGRLAREAAIVSRLAPEARYPEILTVGHDDELEWMVTRRAPGIQLARAWSALSAGHRERAIRELADALAAVHATPCDGIADDIAPPHTLPLAAVVGLIEQLRATTTQQHADLWSAAEQAAIARWSAFDATDRGLVHGDPHLENVVWDGSHVSALLDLEWSRPSWIHCDVEILIAVADDPVQFVATDYAHAIDRAAWSEIPRWLADGHPEWFAHRRLLERLEFLELSRALGLVADALADGDCATTIAWQRLHAVVDSL